MEEFLFVEKYRPKKVSDCILPKRLKQPFEAFVRAGEIPNMLLHGPPGMGKTTIAKAMCLELGINHLYINASRERGVDTVKHKIVSYASTVSMTGGRKVIILDEADNLTSDAQLALRASIEEFTGNCTFVLTCNFKAKLIEALYSRCPSYDFTLKSDEKPAMASQFFKRVSEILTLENITFTKDVVIEIIKKFFPDYRQILGELQKYGKMGAIDAGTLAEIASVQKLDDLIKALKNKDFPAMRKWVVMNSDIDAPHVFRKVYDSLSETMTPESVPQAIVILAKYQYQAAFVSDPEINIVACFTEFMCDCEFV
jgi:DNA polymerase III delta prime subunit